MQDGGPLSDGEKLLSHIDTQIDSHLKFLDQIEQQRWRFTQAFGIAALIGLAFAGTTGSESQTSYDIKHLGYLLALMVSIAGIVTNIRIIGVYWAQWKRIRVLQKFKLEIMKPALSDEVQKSWCLPEIVPNDAKFFKKLTVHEANCLLFSCLFSCSLALMINHCLSKCITFTIPVLLQAILVFIATCVLTYFCHKKGWSYHESVFQSS